MQHQKEIYRKKIVNSPTFDEANYYQGKNFEIGGEDRNQQKEDQKKESQLFDDSYLLRQVQEVLGEERFGLVKVHAHYGVIKLTGHVPHLGHKWQAEMKAQGIPGVMEVRNEIRVLDNAAPLEN